MPDETKDQEPTVEESALPAEEGAPPEAAEPEVEKEEPKETLDKKALREARRDAKKAERKAKRLEEQLAQASKAREPLPFQPPSPPDDPQRLRAEAMAYRQIQKEQFIDQALTRLGLKRDDRRLDYSTPEAFVLSATVARDEDFEEKEAELADKEERLESLEDELRAKSEARLQEMVKEVERNLRRDLGYDKVAKPSPAGGSTDTEANIRKKYQPQLDALKGKGSTVQAMKIIRQMEAEIEEARKKE